jgi:signal-transduction protein with cAMP-binding, CBS, and nucleotidyltransferase domain
MHDDKTTNMISIMTPPPLETSKVGDSLDIIINIMKNKNKGSVVILDESGHPTGIITERDIVRRLVFAKKDAKTTLASEIMSSPLISVNDDVYIYDVAVVMAKYGIRRLPVVKDNVLLGIVTATDLIRRMYEENKKDPCLYALTRSPFLERSM